MQINAIVLLQIYSKCWTIFHLLFFQKPWLLPFLLGPSTNHVNTFWGNFAPPPSKKLLWNSCYWILWLVHGPTRELFEMGFSSPGKYERQVESYHIILKKILYQVQVALLFVECSNYFFIYSVINLETTLYKVHSGFSYIEKP